MRGNTPLSDAFADAAAKSFQAKGFEPQKVSTDPSEEPEQVERRLVESGAPRSLLIDIEEWQSDTYMNVGMSYLLNAVVLDAEGKELARHTITGEQDGKDNLKGSAMNPAGYAKKAVPRAFEDHLKRLLDNEDIVRALS